MVAKGKGKTKTPEKDTKADVEVKEEEQVEETLEVSQAQTDLSGKSIDELEQLKADVESEKIKKHLETEAQRIKDINCPECGANLKQNPEDHIKQGNTPKTVECPECERLIRVYVKYTENPETTAAVITTRNSGYAWINQVPSTWEDKHVLKWVEDEKSRFDKNISSLSPEAQKLFRVQLFILKELKLIE